MKTHIIEFWKNVYLPHVETNCKRSTAEGYKKLWQTYLEKELTGKRLHTYTTAQATRFLTSLCEKGLGVRTVSHVRSLLSGLFGHAVALGTIETNPVRDAKTLRRPERAEETTAYTLKEIQTILTALSEDKLAQIAVALAAYAGLRPSEIAGLRWEDVEKDSLVLRRSVWNGVVSNSLKTEGSAARVPLLSVVKTMLDLLPDKKGWVLSGVSPVRSMDEFARRRMGEPLRKLGIKWRGLYVARRACATIVTELIGSPFAAQAILRHSSPAVTLQFYVRPERERLAAQGIAVLEAALQKEQSCANPGNPSARIRIESKAVEI